mmetsp:Transcript_25279/g.32980  ORF Transcript_25279/g.32980 Transcript_25279/m.32980 type:complete len:225 (+) Transcript_25279:247-921(+)
MGRSQLKYRKGRGRGQGGAAGRGGQGRGSGRGRKGSAIAHLPSNMERLHDERGGVSLGQAGPKHGMVLQEQGADASLAQIGGGHHAYFQLRVEQEDTGDSTHSLDILSIAENITSIPAHERLQIPAEYFVQALGGNVVTSTDINHDGGDESNLNDCPAESEVKTKDSSEGEDLNHLIITGGQNSNHSPPSFSSGGTQDNKRINIQSKEQNEDDLEDWLDEVLDL